MMKKSWLKKKTIMSMTNISKPLMIFGWKGSLDSGKWQGTNKKGGRPKGTFTYFLPVYFWGLPSGGLVFEWVGPELTHCHTVSNSSSLG